jgi:hypothetical protein
MQTQPRHGLDNQRETIGQVIAGPAVELELHPRAVLTGDHPESVVLDFMQPSLAGRRLRRFGGQAWRDKAEREGHERL